MAASALTQGYNASKLAHPLESVKVANRRPLASLPPLWGKDRMGGRAMPMKLAPLGRIRKRNAVRRAKKRDRMAQWREGEASVARPFFP